jgi:surface antigen
MTRPMTKALLLAVTAATLLNTAPAIARDYHDRDRGRWDNNRHDWDRGHGHRDWDRSRWYSNRHYYRPPVVIRSYTSYQPAPVYYAPRPVYVSAPVYRPTQTASRTVCRERNNTLPILLGGVGGGVLGHQFGGGSGNTVATIAGTLIGASIGGSYTSGQECYEQVFETAAVGAPIRFESNEANYSYTLTPTRNYENDGRYCREYQATATVGGRYQETYGTACRQPDGQWEVVN